MLYRGMVCRGRKMTGQARYQLVKKLKIGHIGAAGKAGQIGADRLKDDIEESSTFPKHCQGLALLIVPMHPLACSTKLRMAFKAGIIWN